MNFFQKMGALLLCPLAVGCATLAPGEPAPPTLRLGDSVRPLAYELSLKVDPQQDGFTGRVEIDVDIQRPLDFFWMHGIGLNVQSAVLTSQGVTYTAQPVTAKDRYVGLRFARALPAGPARLSIAYSGQMSLKQTVGMFRQQDLGEWYAYTQFESTYARRAIPSFDEPGWKTPWTLTLTVRKDHKAVSNTPMESERDVGGGFKEVRFAKSKPLPTYLVAFGVGPFDIVDAGTAGMKKTPIRIIVPKGRAAGLDYAKQTMGRILELTENYFGMPYPFEKLDSLGIPITVAFGAMENPGLITYRTSLLVARQGLDDERFRQRLAFVAAHEIAHQWFGDLVTMQWWDDIWLNESFANWMERKTIQQFNPSWESIEPRERDRQRAFRSDRLATARQIRNPVEFDEEIENAFDGITYAKGGAVLSMFENWLGEDKFREGVRAYMKKHAYGNANAYDFFEAVSGTDPQVAQGFASFVMQPGLPVVDFELDCTTPKPSVLLRQQRFAPALPQPGTQSWTIPVCVRHEGSDTPTCTMMREREQRMTLDKAAQCPAWIVPNPGGSGYYLSRLGPNASRGLARAPLQVPDALAMVGERSLLANSASLPVQQLLDLLTVLSRDPRPQVVAAAAGAAAAVDPARFDETSRAAFRAWVRTQFGPRARELGWIAKPGESDAVHKERAAVVRLVADVGLDADLQAQARTLAAAWLAGDHRTLGAGHGEVLTSAARSADTPMFETFVKAARESQDGSTRTEIYRALGHVRNPALRERAFSMALAGPGDQRELREIFDAAGFEAEGAEPLLAFVRQHHPELLARLPQENIIRMPRWHVRLCSRESGDAVRSLYAQQIVQSPATKRTLDQALESIEICAKGRAAS